MTNNTAKTARIGTKNARSLGRTALVFSVAAAIVGSGAVSAGAAGTTRPGGGQTGEVTRNTLALGAPGFMARIDDGRRVKVTAAGVADRATRRPLTGREQFEAGSNTKTFTATLALQLVDEGKLRLDAPVEDYLPGVVPNGRNITIRMLLNHTSGLFSYTETDNFFDEIMNDPNLVHTEDDLLRRAFQHEPYFAPGASWHYSNTNYTLVGIIVQKLTGKRLPDLIQQRIARPLGLQHTYLADPRATNTGRGYAHGYTIVYGDPRPTYIDTTGWPLAWGGAAGALITNQQDLSRFFSAVLRGKLFSKEQLRQMKTTVRIPDEFLPVAGDYGLGLMRKETSCGPVWGHGGDTNGHHSTAVTTEDGRRTAVSDTTIEPGGGDQTRVLRYYEVAIAAEKVIGCQMLGRTASDEVLQQLRGTAPAATGSR